MTFTPSATSSFSAGAVFWGMVWATLGKLNELAHFVGFKKVQSPPDRAALDQCSQSRHHHPDRSGQLFRARHLESTGCYLRSGRNLGEHFHGHVHRAHLVPAVEPGKSLIVPDLCPR